MTPHSFLLFRLIEIFWILEVHYKITQHLDCRSRFAGKSMAATSLHKFAQCITCHAWSPDLSMIALCPKNSEVHIYKLSEDKWEKVHVLQKHDQIVSGMDWSSRSNKIVTVSHDRNSYVWNQETTGWVPTLVILRLNRAALCVQWSPKENKYPLEVELKLWVSKLIRKRRDSSVTSIAWHPNNILLATTSTDGRCRVFSTFIKGVDAKESVMGDSADTKFGEQIVQLNLCFCWAFGVRWSPSGNTLAYVGHNSMIYFVDEVGPSAAAQSVAIHDLPLRDVLFLSERMVVGVGFDCNPMVFVADESGLWCFLRFLDERKAASSSAKYGSQFSEAFLGNSMVNQSFQPATMLSSQEALMTTVSIAYYHLQNRENLVSPVSALQDLTER